MYNFVYIGLFILLHIVDVSVQAVSCPTSRNQPVNITRVTDRLLVTWVKTVNSGVITNAVYNSTTGGCNRPSNNDNYTIYCERFDNNNYRFTLQVHQPTEGDVYFTSGDNKNITNTTEEKNTKTSIIFQDPVNIEPELKDNITLTNDRKTQLKTSITCTPLTPVFTWIIKSQNGTNTTINGSTTGCDVTETTLTSTVTISKDTVKIINDPFTVSVQLSYNECDNIYTSQPTPYFTVKNVSGVHESDPVPPPYMYIGIGVGGAVLLVIIIIVVILCCCWKRKEKNKKTDSRESITRTSPNKNGIDSHLKHGEIIIDENVEYVSQGGIFSDTVQYAVVNKKPETGRKKDEIIVDENVEYVGLDDAASPPVVPRRGYQESKPSKRGEEGLKYVDVDFSNQKPAAEIRGANRQSTVQYSQIQPKH